MCKIHSTILCPNPKITVLEVIEVIAGGSKARRIRPDPHGELICLIHSQKLQTIHIFGQFFLKQGCICSTVPIELILSTTFFFKSCPTFVISGRLGQLGPINHYRRDMWRLPPWPIMFYGLSEALQQRSIFRTRGCVGSSKP